MDAAEVLRLLRRRWFPVLLCIVMGLAGAFAVSRSVKDRYEASTRLFISIPAASDVQEALQGVQLSSYLLQSYARIATSTLAADEIADRLDLTASAGDISGHLRASVEEQTLLITITASEAEPEGAQALANTAAEVFIDLVADIERGRSEPATARVIDRATLPSQPISSGTRQNLVAGGMLGVIVGAGLALLLEALDRSIRTTAGAGKATGLPILGVVPRRRHLALVDPSRGRDSPAAEAYRTLRTSLRFGALGATSRSVLVTSPTSSEGKSTTVANLAAQVAKAGERVIVVDADLRRPRQAHLLGVDGSRGLTNVLAGEARLDEVLVQSETGALVLPSGPLPPNPAELVGSQAMADLVAALETKADLVLIDVPPVLVVTDAVALSTQVGSVVLVVRAGETARGDAAEAVQRLHLVGAELAGVVLNGAPKDQVPGASDYRYPTEGPKT